MQLLKLDWQASLAEDSISSMVSSGIIASQTAQRLGDCLVKGGCTPEEQDQTQATLNDYSDTKAAAGSGAIIRAKETLWLNGGDNE